MSDINLVWLDRASQAIARVATIGEAKEIADKAAAIKLYARKQKWSFTEKGRIADIEVRAGIRLGELLKVAKKDEGGRPTRNGKTGTRSGLVLPPYAKIGITKNEASAAQRAASVSRGAVERYLAECVEAGRLPNLVAVARMAKIKEREKRNGCRRPVELPSGEFDVLYADPPWKYDFCITDSSRAIENQYPTMNDEAIAALTVPAAKDCVLFLWATMPKLREALMVMERWGFEYKTGAVWDKELIGMGYWFRGQHELLLVGTRGNVSPPAASARPASVIRARRGKHSAKPEVVYDLIGGMFPTARRCELFCRTPREGWASWGNEA